MRHGYHANLVFSKSGNLIALATGSDACTEHEMGSETLQRALSSAYDSDSDLVVKLRAGEPVQYPGTMERKRIHKNLDRIQFIEVPARGDDEPQAILGYVDRGTDMMYFKRELEFANFASDADKNVAGAWGEDSFAIRVRSKKYVKALKAFHEAMKQGKVLFAGSFLRQFVEGRPRLGGVILADSRYLPDEDRAEMAKADAEYASKLRLTARDDTDALRREMMKASGQQMFSCGHISARWKDEQESEVVYNLNPSYDCRHRAEYGRYTRQQLLDWAQGGYRGQLKNSAPAVSA